MAELFENNNKMTIYVGDKELIDYLYQRFDINYNAQPLKDYLSDIWSYITSAKIIDNGKEIDKRNYFPKDCKINGLRKDTSVMLCALLHSDSRNIRQLLDIMPEYISKVISLAIINGYIGEYLLECQGVTTEIFGAGGSDSYWSTNYCKGRFASLFITFRSGGHRDYSELYLKLPGFLRPFYASVLFPNLTRDNLYSDTVPQGFQTICAENSFIESFPLISALFCQGKVTMNGFKITSAAASKVLKTTSIMEVIPSAFKESTGQYFLPFINKSFEKKKNLTPEKCVREAFRYMRMPLAQTFMPAMLPHYKGFKANVMKDVGVVQWGYLLQSLLSKNPDKWLDLEMCRDYLFNYVEDINACPFKSSDLYRFDLENKYLGEYLCLDIQRDEIDMELIKAIAVAMYGMGMVELSIHINDGEDAYSPCQHVTHIKLTELGKYALEVTEKYESKKIEVKEYFKLDSDYQIVTCLGDNNPYEVLLSEIATSIGGKRYRIDSGSFLKNCVNAKDVEEKIKFFKDYICAKPPKIWDDFFLDIKQRCYPFVSDSASYIMMKIDAGHGNQGLVKLLTTDPKLRSMIVLVEGYRLLVKKENMSQFKTLMKERGYLI